MAAATLDSLLPHQPPMRLLDRIVWHDSQSLYAVVTPQESSLFARDAGVHAVIGLEYMAQASAAFFTLQATSEQAPRQGMLIACRDYQCQVPFFAVEQSLFVQVTLMSKIQPVVSGRGLVKFRGNIYLDVDVHALYSSAFSVEQLSPDTALVSANFSVYL